MKNSIAILTVSQKILENQFRFPFLLSFSWEDQREKMNHFVFQYFTNQQSNTASDSITSHSSLPRLNISFSKLEYIIHR